MLYVNAQGRSALDMSTPHEVWQEDSFSDLYHGLYGSDEEIAL